MSTVGYTRPEPRLSRMVGRLLYDMLTDKIVAYWNEKANAVRYWNDTQDVIVDTNVVRAAFHKGVVEHGERQMRKGNRVALVVTDVGRQVQERRWRRTFG